MSFDGHSKIIHFQLFKNKYILIDVYRMLYTIQCIVYIILLIVYKILLTTLDMFNFVVTIHCIVYSV